MYVFSEKSTRHAISRSTYRKIEQGDIVQLNLSAKVDGYSPVSACPSAWANSRAVRRRSSSSGSKRIGWTLRPIAGGRARRGRGQADIDFFKQRGHYEHYLYGPLPRHGLIEVEAPWMESISNYHLAENMTFQVDTFVSTEEFGIRWETGGCDPQGPCRSAVPANRERLWRLACK